MKGKFRNFLIFLVVCMQLQCNYGYSQTSFELKIDLPHIYEYPSDLKQLNDGNYATVINRQRPNFEWKLLSVLALINSSGDIITQDSLIIGDTIFNINKIIPYNDGIIAFGHYGFFNDTAWLKPLGQFIAYYEITNNNFYLTRLKKYYIRDSLNNTLYWADWPVNKDRN